ncbi:hypothetical protein [Paenarthrobacter nitroguajacolicus]|uniref:hypothetical protein n=1 Tax=Paenarthrobacter nitroguajacolicus TaxID=211146 RepID=UPI00248CDC08|nr:hypothetical protein [Paenarthrobacter nitroguajacolicus]MDI2036819.1 hypothetical protein [Paenarthrobacter nitroguajacolicus]
MILGMTPVLTSAQTKENRKGFGTLTSISVLTFIVFAVMVQPPIANFVGAMFVGVGGMLMVGIRFFQQNAARALEEAEKVSPNKAPTLRAPWGSRPVTALVSWVKRPSSAARNAERERVKAEKSEAMAIKKAVEAFEDLGFGLLGLGGLIVAASALQGCIDVLFGSA